MGIRTEVENLVHTLRGATEEPGEEAMLTAIKDDIAQMKADIAQMKADITQVKADITALKDFFHGS